jgi:hypothetical protein
MYHESGIFARSNLPLSVSYGKDGSMPISFRHLFRTLGRDQVAEMAYRMKPMSQSLLLRADPSHRNEAAFSHNLVGPFPLVTGQIDAEIQEKCPGAYVLGSGASDDFRASFVGRSDSDLNASLKEHVGAYTHFRFGYSESAREAFEYECQLYHAYSPRHSRMHPIRPRSVICRCPVCHQ